MYDQVISHYIPKWDKSLGWDLNYLEILDSSKPLVRIKLTTSFLPRMRSITEL